MRTVHTALLCSLSCVAAVTTLDAQGPNFVPGQILLRFADDSPQHAKVIEVSRTNPLNLSGLDDVIDELGVRVHLPLAVEQLGSGYWITLGVNRHSLWETIERFLSEENGVAAVARQDVDGTSSATSRRFQLQLIDGSQLARAFERRDVGAILARWASDVHVPLMQTADGDHLTIEVDWSAATLELLERITILPEVEAAQPNYSQMR